MLPSPSSSPPSVLVNRTNISDRDHALNASGPWFSLPTPEHGKVKRRTSIIECGSKKRLKPTIEHDRRSMGNSSSEESDSDMEDMVNVRAQARKGTVFQILSSSVTSRPTGRMRNVEITTRPILQSFVSSHKSDVFVCESEDVETYRTPPYACSYTHAAKGGGLPLLAVSTEQGTVHVLNTSRRREWDVEPSRTTYRPHENGIFDVKWNMSDTLLATSSGDQTTRISCPETSTSVSTLRGHTSTVKCVAWDPHHTDLLSTGSRDGSICIWDLRVGGRRDATNAIVPVKMIVAAHEDLTTRKKPAPRGRKTKAAPAAKSITSMVYSDMDPFILTTSGSSDGILHSWDLRFPSDNRKRKSAKPKLPLPTTSSPSDPTTSNTSRRSRGITSIVAGSGPTNGLLFALGADSRVHTYSWPSLTALPTEYTDERMQTNSFYVRVAASACGRWLATGGTGPNGTIVLFDASNASRNLKAKSTSIPRGVVLSGQTGEVGAVDWASDMLATCADDGSVRIWRPDVDEYVACVADPEERKWGWSWATLR